MTTTHHQPIWLQDYVHRGFQLVYYPTKQKGPTGADAVGWPTRLYRPEDWHGENVGVKLGIEVQPGRYLVDVDFDWAGGMVLAKRLLPPAGFGFGRSGRITHAFYTISQPIPSKQYVDVTGRTLVELRCRKIDNSIGLQTMVPPSVHPTGEVLEVRATSEITHDDTLPRRMILYAIGCELLFHLGERGFGHLVRMGFAGFFLQAGLDVDEVLRLGEALCEATSNNPKDLQSSVQSTVNTLKRGEKVTGRRSLIEALGDDGKKIVSRIKEWLGGGEFITNEKDQILANSQENIKRALRKLDCTLHYDEFRGREMIRWNDFNGLIDKEAFRRLYLEIDSQFHFRPVKEFFEDVIFDIASQHKLHPVKEYLNDLKWDGKARLDTWLIDCAKAGDSQYTRAVSSIVLIAAVRRIRRPGCKFDELLVLESDQGKQKSTAVKSLCPNEDWFSDDLPLNVDGKQTIERTEGKWIIEAAELAGMHRSKVEHLKSFLSRSVDGGRLSYDRLTTERPRQFIIIGTTNSYAYLKDTTGNRRFWPVRVKQFDLKKLSSMRDQLWAEAAYREAQGISIRLDESLYEAAELQQDRRKIEDSWSDLLDDYVIELKKETKPGQRLRTSTALTFRFLGIGPAFQTPELTERLSSLMQAKGFRRQTVSVQQPGEKKKHVVKGWVRDYDLTQPTLSENEDES